MLVDYKQLLMLQTYLANITHPFTPPERGFNALFRFGFILHSEFRIPHLSWCFVKHQPVESQVLHSISELVEVHRFSDIAICTELVALDSIPVLG